MRKKNNKQFLPFFLVDHGSCFSLCLCVGKYKEDLIEARFDDCFDGSGYAWEALARIFILEIMPEFLDKVKFDSESSMFCAFSDSKD